RPAARRTHLRALARALGDAPGRRSRALRGGAELGGLGGTSPDRTDCVSPSPPIGRREPAGAAGHTPAPAARPRRSGARRANAGHAALQTFPLPAPEGALHAPER